MKTIRQTPTIRGATPHDIYETIGLKKACEARRIADSHEPPGRRRPQGWRRARGKESQVIQDKTIVQSWRANDWPKGVYSRATFSLAGVKAGTRMTSRQSGVPEKHYRSITLGWRKYYWEPLKRTFSGGRSG